MAPDEPPVLAAEVPELAPDLEGLAIEAPALEADAVLELAISVVGCTGPAVAVA